MNAATGTRSHAPPAVPRQISTAMSTARPNTIRRRLLMRSSRARSDARVALRALALARYSTAALAVTGVFGATTVTVPVTTSAPDAAACYPRVADLVCPGPGPGHSARDV